MTVYMHAHTNKEHMHIYQILTCWACLPMSTVQGSDLLAGSAQPMSQTWLLTTAVTTNVHSHFTIKVEKRGKSVANKHIVNSQHS